MSSRESAAKQNLTFGYAIPLFGIVLFANFTSGLVINSRHFDALVGSAMGLILSEFSLLSVLLPLFESSLPRRVIIGTTVGLILYLPFAAGIITYQRGGEIDELTAFLPLMSFASQIPFWMAQYSGSVT